MSYIKKFNPYDMPEETLLAIATGRERVLERILATIARNAEGGAVQHLQVVAPRGYGKSFLMRLVQSAVKARAAEGLPVALALLPEEQHNVDAPHRLLNEIQRVLEGRPADSLLGGAFSESEAVWDPAVAALDASIAARLPEGRGIVVAMVENFDQLMAEVFRKPQDQSRLRALLARPGGRLMLLATATRRADANYEQRLFHATGLIELEPWQEESCLAFFERLRGHRHAEPMPPKTRAKAQAIAQFIGGSPRMATVLAQVLDSNDSLQAAAMLDALVDELTPYYKHRIESLSRRARTLLDALLRMGEPRTQSEIAERLGTTQARIAEPFNELRARGEVLGVKAQRSAEMLYRVCDRLMAHYYRKRHLTPGEAASLLEGITELLVGFYSPEEKRAEAERLRALGRTADAAVLERLVAEDLAPAISGRPNSAAQDGWLDRMMQLFKAGHVNEAVALGHQTMKRADSSGDEEEQSVTACSLGWALGQMERYAEAADALSRAIGLAEQAGDLNVQAVASRHLGWVLGQMERYAEAVDTLRRATALAEQAGDLNEQAIASRHLGVALAQMERHSEAVDALRRAIAVAEQAGDLNEQVMVSRHLGWVLGQMERYAEAVDMLRRAIVLAEQDGDLVEQVETARHLGLALGRVGRHVEAVDMLRRAIDLAEQTGDASEITRIAIILLEEAQANGDDETVVLAWQRAVAVTPATEKLSIHPWFSDVAAAALRTGQFGTVWHMAAALPTVDQRAWGLGVAQRELAETVGKASRTQGRAAAYSLAVQWFEVLAQDAANRTMRDGTASLEPLSFLRGILLWLAGQVDDPSLLRDIAALLEQRLPSETVVERALLDAAARRAERPDDPAALERVDPDIVTVLDRLLGVESKPASKTSARRSKRSGTTRRKK